VYYADLEAILKKLNNKRLKARHEACAYSFFGHESSFLIPVDANNLYGDAMSFKLPCKAFKWCTTEELKYLEEHLLEIPNSNDIGYTLKVSLDYPKELHDKHNDYPFFPIHKDIKNEDLSPYQKKLRKITKNLES
jgi:hypothetical protein